MTALDDLKAPYQAAFDRLNDLLTHGLPLAHTPHIASLAQAILGSKGKQLRPLLVFLAHGKPPDDACIQVAAAIELIHMASLIHDDILDHATIRHQLPTIVAQFGQELAIPSGVWLYAKALECLVQAGELAVIHEMSRTVDWLCRGEMTQVVYRNQFAISPLAYFRIIHQKTASLFGTAAWAGAYANPKRRYAMKQFGKSLGVLYQLTDDVLDFIGDDTQLQKIGGQDMKLGEITYPIIVALAESTPDNRSLLCRLLSQKDPSTHPDIVALIQQTQAVELTLQCIHYYRNRCQLWCQQMPMTTQHALLGLVDMVCYRVTPWLERLNDGQCK